MDWRYSRPKNLLLVRRDLYDVWALMTEDEYRHTEPYVEAVARITPTSVKFLDRKDENDKEVYTIRGEDLPLFTMPVRVGTAEEMEMADGEAS